MEAGQQDQNYGGLDAFRMIAAFLVIAIHTSPLTMLNADADFFLTRILARLAVPFFFMVTGQFILSGSEIWDYIKKITLLYAAAILIYLPVGIYAGHYKNLTIRQALQMLVFDDTFYHLWYFPACIIGVLVVYVLRRFLSIHATLVVTGILYLIGLFGDSYYGLAAKIPVISSVYDMGFQIFSYTRNGLFLAPIFLLTSAITGNRNQKYTFNPINSGIGFIISFLLMTVEGMALRHFHLQRHDSMYLFLIPCMFFLYQLLLSWKVNIKSGKQIRTLSTWIYILHPAVIVLVRGIARFLNMTPLLVENSLIHYFAVCIFSAGISRGIVCLTARRNPVNQR